MKNRKGFISTSIIYSFFLVFILLMIASIMSYANKRFLIDSSVNSWILVDFSSVSIKIRGNAVSASEVLPRTEKQKKYNSFLYLKKILYKDILSVLFFAITHPKK